MNPIDFIGNFLTFLATIPFIGHYLQIIASYAIPATAIISALVGVWHGVVAVFVALAQVPGLSFLSGIAQTLQVDGEAVDGFINKWILPILNRFSMIPLPKLKKKE